VTSAPPAARRGAAPGLGPDSVLRRRESLAWQEVAGEVVVLDLDGMVLRGLNRSGGRILRLIDGRATLAEIAAAIAAHYAIPAERALADLVAFAGSLLEKGVLEEAPAGAPR
jgi:hypothetical protein